MRTGLRINANFSFKQRCWFVFSRCC